MSHDSDPPPIEYVPGCALALLAAIALAGLVFAFILGMRA